MQCLKLDQELKTLVKTERKITHEILLIIQTLYMTKSYRELGYSSLFEYFTKEIGYSEGSAQRRISAAKLIKQCPKIEDELKSGNLNLTQVALAQTAIKQEEKAQEVVLSPEKKSEIIDKLKNKSGFETKKILKEELPSFELPQSKINPTNNKKVHVTLEFSETEKRSQLKENPQNPQKIYFHPS